MNQTSPTVQQLSRRAFLQGSTLLLAAPALTSARLTELCTRKLQDPQETDSKLKLGLITDLHHADKPAAGSRHYRETLTKLEEAASQFAEDDPQFIVELGDLIDAADDVDTELAYLETVHSAIDQLPGEKHFVLGNHCVHTLTKDEFLSGVGQEQSHLSWDAEGWHFVVLDACFRSDGVAYGRKNFEWTDTFIPQEQLDWLRADLEAAEAPTIVFAHQRLDVDNHYGVKNAAAVRQILESAKLDGQPAVRAVFQGHSHKNDLKEHGGIPYCTLVAMVEGSGAENNGFSTLHIEEDQTLRLTGFRQQSSREWKPTASAANRTPDSAAKSLRIQPNNIKAATS